MARFEVTCKDDKGERVIRINAPDSQKAGDKIREKYPNWEMVIVKISPPSKAQQLAWMNRNCAGGIGMIKKSINATKQFPISETNRTKVINAYGLIEKQISKLERDMRELFILQGLQVK